jgi:hypothetical protein
MYSRTVGSPRRVINGVRLIIGQMLEELFKGALVNVSVDVLVLMADLDS